MAELAIVLAAALLAPGLVGIVIAIVRRARRRERDAPPAPRQPVAPRGSALSQTVTTEPNAAGKVFCQACGRSTPADAKYCRTCGTALAET